MLSKFKQNILFLIFACLSINIVALTGIHIVAFAKTMPRESSYEVIDCGDATGRIHKCIRIDPRAGEINDAAKGASYRVIFGQ
jgi:hypothetical protein